MVRAVPLRLLFAEDDEVSAVCELPCALKRAHRSRLQLFLPPYINIEGDGEERRLAAELPLINPCLNAFLAALTHSDTIKVIDNVSHHRRHSINVS